MTAPDLPPLEELLAGLRVVSIPMRVRFRGVMVREAALLQGPSGWGEFSPFLEYPPAESSRWLAAAIEAGWGQWPAAMRDSIPVNATVPAVAPDQVAGVLARFDGATTAKVKVAEQGQSIEDDVCRVAAVRDAIGPGGRIRVDANGGWSVDEATDALRRLAAYGLEYAEQPCAEVSELRELRLALARNGIAVLVAADESIRKAADPIRVAREEAADLVVVKVAPLGGVARALEVVADCGLPAVVSSALDTSVGMAAGVALAAALPDLPFACGLGTVALLEGDVCKDSLTPRGGALPVGRAAPDEALLTRWTASAAREGWWRARVEAAHSHLTSSSDTLDEDADRRRQ
ncbi:o-succinylbenzoate synthase [Pedococcus bigeumensis]|uniref:o-succinylbenzoate synthase n=1 Tax=Pedococcus bigeumensis TaxID=433644 RepID=A0A502CR15_9MICO|nr:o-succinylbenzoate synthase [Pedococcus bigeumensis]TPG15124.1 O-succinylbenzoate synthase [Pedococcus bigeumensis]